MASGSLLMASQEYPVNAGVSQGSILSPSHVLLYIYDLLDDVVICNIDIYADGTTLYSGLHKLCARLRPYPQTALRVHENLCARLIPLSGGNLNLPIYFFLPCAWMPPSVHPVFDALR